jgi:dihydroorotase
VSEDEKALPFAEAEPGATGLELLLSLALKWSQDSKVPLLRAMATITNEAARVLKQDMGQLKVGAQADVCILDLEAHWQVTAQNLRSQGKFTPFSGYDLPGRVRYTLVGGQIAYQA